MPRHPSRKCPAWLLGEQPPWTAIRPAPLMRSGVFGNEVDVLRDDFLDCGLPRYQAGRQCIGRLISDRLRIDAKEINASLSISKYEHSPACWNPLLTM